jgi:hypothetical protein
MADQSKRLLSVEAVAALILALVNLALDQAEIHILLISWISIIICVALAIDALRRTAWVTHPIRGSVRFWAGSSGLVLAFLAFGVFLSLHKAEAKSHAAIPPSPRPFRGDLDCHVAIQPGVMCTINFTHAARTDGREDFVGSEMRSMKSN